MAGGMITPALNVWKSYRVSIGVLPNKPLWGSSKPPPSRPPCHTIPAMVPSGHAQPPRCTGQTSHPCHRNRQTNGIPQQGRATAVDGSKIPISGQGYRRYPCHPPWHLPPGVGLRSPQRSIQGQGIGRAGTTIKPMRWASAGPSMALSAYSRNHLGWVHGRAGSGRERPARTSCRMTDQMDDQEHPTCADPSYALSNEIRGLAR